MDKALDLIVNGSDFESVLKEILVEQGLDPWNLDIVPLSTALLNYMNELVSINFRIPARFIIVSAILLRMKSETLMPKEIEPRIPETLDLNNLGLLEMPIKRMPARNITFDELVFAINKVLKGTQVKEDIRISKEQKIENIKKMFEWEIDNYVDRIYGEIQKKRKTTYFSLTKGKAPIDSAKYFVAMLHLANQQKVEVCQEVLFEDIQITLKELEEIQKELDKLNSGPNQNNSPSVLQNIQNNSDDSSANSSNQ
jgi:chromatin segregation and condensation protein Rec8/ScpA/Scc1 (kleisin family)